MSAVTPAKKAAVIGEGSLKGLWTLTIEHSELCKVLDNFSVVYQTGFDNGHADIFGSVNTKGALTALDLQHGIVETDPDFVDAKEVISFHITYNGAVYRFFNGQRSASNPGRIHGGVIHGPDFTSDGEDGSWSAQATPNVPDE